MEVEYTFFKIWMMIFVIVILGTLLGYCIRITFKLVHTFNYYWDYKKNREIYNSLSNYYRYCEDYNDLTTGLVKFLGFIFLLASIFLGLMFLGYKMSQWLFIQ